MIPPLRSIFPERRVIFLECTSGHVSATLQPRPFFPCQAQEVCAPRLGHQCHPPCCLHCFPGCSGTSPLSCFPWAKLIPVSGLCSCSFCLKSSPRPLLATSLSSFRSRFTCHPSRGPPCSPSLVAGPISISYSMSLTSKHLPVSEITLVIHFFMLFPCLLCFID